MQQTYNIQRIDPSQFEYQLYSVEDTSLITIDNLTDQFNSATDYIEYYVYDGNQSLVYKADQGQFTSYNIYDNNLYIDPQANIQELGFTNGLYYTSYNFFTNIVGSSPTSKFYISEISSDRTELRLDSTVIADFDIKQGAEALIVKLANSTYYYDFYLNFGDNKQVIANNIYLDTTDASNTTILIKLYEPLPDEYQINAQLWIVEEISQPVAYSINIVTVFDELDTTTRIKGPNFSVTTGQIANSTVSTTYDDIVSTTTQPSTGSILYQLQSILEEKGIEINIDYSNYNNFIHFSSAQTRLENFYHKLTLLEQYQQSASFGTGTTTTYTSASSTTALLKIEEIIKNFDGYEYYLYYTSASTAWPKTNNTPPYTNYSSNSTEGLQWLALQLETATTYDNLNVDGLIYSIPPYLKDDPNNSQLQLFVEMLGQHFDTLWTYVKDISNKYNTDNRLDHGISKDLIADTLRSFGIKIYENNFSTQNLYSSLLGITPQGSLLNIPNISLTTPTPTGLEYITDYVLASPTSSLLPLDDANKEIYKRIYHNLPLLLKKKGTTAGLKLLLNIYGIPDTILRINEFGGQDRTNTNDWDNWQDTFNYALALGPTNPTAVEIAHRPLVASGQAAKSIELRFKTSEFPPTNASQSILELENTEIGLYLIYTGSGLTSASYSGSTYDPYYQYGTLKWVSGSTDPGNSGVSASVYLPFFNGDWWSILLTTSGSGPYTWNLTAAQKGEGYIKYAQSSSTSFISTISEGEIVFLGSNEIADPETYFAVSGALQEFRYYTVPITSDVFEDYVLNPYSIEGNTISGISSSFNTLAFRAPLGTDLLATYTTLPIALSTHPAVTGSSPTASFILGVGDYTSDYSVYDPVWIENQEMIYQKQPNAGIQIAVSDKIKIGQPNMPIGDVLSAYTTIQQRPVISQSYTSDVNYVEVAFSPQDEINDDIIDQLGYFNIGEYIGDPRFESSSATSYPDLNTLRNEYFAKYIRNYDLTDYLRLIKFFDNSLFKMIKDFVPARTGLATGAIIKQHLLERNRYTPPQASWEDITYSGSVTSLSSGYATGSKIYTFTGSTGGTVPYLQNYTSSGYYPPYINISQSWQEIVTTPSGSNTITHNTLDEFYNGEFKGTSITITDGSLTDEDCQIFLDVNVAETNYIPVVYNYTFISESVFLTEVLPLSGEISIYYTRDFLAEGAPNRPSTITD